MINKDVTILMGGYKHYKSGLMVIGPMNDYIKGPLGIQKGEIYDIHNADIQMSSYQRDKQATFLGSIRAIILASKSP